MVGDPHGLLSFLVLFYQRDRGTREIIARLRRGKINANQAVAGFFGGSAVENKIVEFFRLVSEKDSEVFGVLSEVRFRRMAVDDAEKEILEAIKESV